MSKPNFVIVVDSRENLPLTFPSREIERVREALDTGDYGIRIEGQLSDVRIERKGLGDLYHSFSGESYRREKDKIKRAQDLGLRYILAVEGCASRIRQGHSYFKGGRWHRVKKDGLTMIRQLESISTRYHVELRYCQDRQDMAFMVQEILLTYVRNHDR